MPLSFQLEKFLSSIPPNNIEKIVKHSFIQQIFTEHIEFVRYCIR